jgi:hypothetical protein
MFLHENVIYSTGTHHISSKYKGYNTFLFAKEHFKLSSNKATFDWFRENYPQIKEKPRAKEIKLEEEIDIDFTHKLPFTR